MNRFNSSIPLFALSLGLILLFPPEITSDHASHNHSLYVVSLILPGVFFLLALLKLSQTIVVRRTQFFISLFIAFFALLTFSPASATFKHNHQMHSAMQHACCIPQVATHAQEITVIPLVQSVSQIPIENPIAIQKVFTPPTNSRSPPNFLS